MMSYRMEIVEDKDEGGIAAAMGSTMPTTANPTAQGMISVISFAVNVFIFAYILKRAKAQKKNPWKEEIFTDTRDYQEAMAKSKIKRIKEFRRILYGCSKTVSVQDFFVLF